MLRKAAGRLPRFLEVRDSHPLSDRDGFQMLPGFENFQPVHAGQVVARDHGGVVRCPEAARIFMPLYQEIGHDGFFLVGTVTPLWLDEAIEPPQARAASEGGPVWH